MALSKNRAGSRGYLTCAVHCLIYTACVVAFTRIFALNFIMLVFLSHYVIDRLSLAELWLKLIRGRSIEEYLVDSAPLDRHMVARGGFTTLVYAVADNTMHLAVVYYGWRLLSL